MSEENILAQELKKYQCICFYPSAGRDLSDLDYFGSGCKPREERIACSGDSHAFSHSSEILEPDLFLHTDVNFYQEYAAGFDLQPHECGLHGPCEIRSHCELPRIKNPNAIYDNFPHSGRVFEYKLKVWNSRREITLLYCLSENEFVVSRILLAYGVRIPYVWSRDWFGGRTYGTWLTNVFDRLQTVKFFTDWLCVPGQRGEPSNRAVVEKYPELMATARVRLVKNESHRWIEEGAHGWIEEYDVLSCA